MRKPLIVCVGGRPRELEALARFLDERLARRHDLLRLGAEEDVFAALEELTDRGRPVTLILCDPVLRDRSGRVVLERLRDRHPETVAIPIDSIGPVEAAHRAAQEAPPGSFSALESLLRLQERVRESARKRESLERKAARLEALHRIGVSLSASFDIGAILRETARGVALLVGDAPVDVFYPGSPAINSRPLWFPDPSAPGHLSPQDRGAVETILRGHPPGNGEQQRVMLSERTGREVLAVSRQETVFALVFFSTGGAPAEPDRELLSMLALQAATALQNIHLAQERLRLERLSAFGRMIGSLVHDLRSPLTAIRGYVGMLGENPSPHRSLYARLLLEECDRLNEMIHEMLEFTRGRDAEPALRRVELREYLADVLRRLHPHIENAGILLETRIEYDGPVHLDPHRMTRALLNLAVNACQAMKHGGRLRVGVRREGEALLIELADEGCGIPEDIRHRIFEPFFSYGKAQGIGLGMAIARKIIEEHGGEIQLVSEAGRGTTVRILLPRLAPSPGESGARCGEPAATASSR